MSVERTYVGDTAYFPDLGRWLDPGDSVEFDEAPEGDSRFLTAGEAKKAAPEIRQAKKTADPAPEAPAEVEES